MQRHKIHFFIFTAVLVIALQGGCYKSNQSSLVENSAPTSTPPLPHTISGVILFPDGPHTDSEALLNSYKDEQCVKLKSKNIKSPEETNQFNDCRKKEVVKVSVDEKGNYKLTPPNPGWYDLMIKWWSDKTLGGTSGYKDVGDFQLIYAQKKDDPSKVRFLAVKQPFYFTGQEDVVKNLSLQK